mmetsp:Transcript_19058/g.16893  ORF Transcript_19058/g.16893 Transcript_19058/m.16893 type:complete len:94 (+) Transcript_19058:311-592(+)
MNNFSITRLKSSQFMDNEEIIKRNKKIRLYSISIYGKNYIEAIKLEHIIDSESENKEFVTSFACGYNFKDTNQMPETQIFLEDHELIDQVSLC